MKNVKYLLWIGSASAVMAVTGLTGCSWGQAKEGRETGRTAAQVADDEHITSRVKSDLTASPFTSSAVLG